MGDPESQNVVGFMLYHGEGVAMDRSAARAWFEQAASGGSERARRNLVSMAASPATTAPGVSTARQQASTFGDGERLFVKYCGGCHGFNGIAYYPHAPSFALGDRMEKPDAELMRSLREGHAAMPSWEEKLRQDDLRLILAAVRRLPARYDAGVDASMSGTPHFYYLFGPMEVPLGQSGK
jgi:mono/diheme cytochrome c family protein